MENCVAPGLDEFDVLLEVVLSLVRVCQLMLIVSKIQSDTLQYTRRRDKWISLSKLIGIYYEISFFTIQ